jgi:sugar lactone lactonase YvrE
MSTAHAIASTRDRVGECPVWSVAEQALYWVDIEGRQIRRWTFATEQVQSWALPERVGCIAVAAAGGVVAAMETGIYAVQLDEVTPRLRCLASITHPAPGMRFNDGRCDTQGRFWVCTMVMDMGLASPLGAIYCLDGKGLSTARMDGFITPNGMAFSADGRTGYVSDSHPSVQKIWRFALDADGMPGPRELFADMQPLPGRPDGAALDVEGHYWICANDAGLVHRFDPQGRLVASLEVPVAKPSMCAFGGPDLDVLYVASIQPGNVDPANPGLNGAVFALKPGVRGLPEPLFR